MNETEFATLWTKTQDFLSAINARYHNDFHEINMMVYRYPGKDTRKLPEFCVRCLYKPSTNGKHYEIEDWVGYGITLSGALINLQEQVKSLFPPDKYPVVDD